MMGVLAMSQGQLDRKQALQLRERFSQLNEVDYAAEMAGFANRFFEDGVTRESHGEMVAATYIWERRDQFWSAYWEAFSVVLTTPALAARAVDILGFWFDASLSALVDYPYVVQTFFLELPEVVEAARKERGAADAGREISRRAASQPWFPLVQQIFVPERKGIMKLFGR
jgi:hypothetical protein